MAYPPARSMNAELRLGTIEGSYKTIHRNRGGITEDATYRMRQDLSDVWYGIHETPVKTNPFSRQVTTPNWTPNRPADPRAL